MKTIVKIFSFVGLLFLQTTGSCQSKSRLHFLGRWDNDSLKSIGGQTFNNLTGWAATDGREYAIIGATDSIYFIEVSDPKRPVVRSAKAGKYNRCVHRDMKTYSHYAYCVADEGGSSLQIFDLKYLPDSVHKVYDSDTLIALAHSIYIEYPWIYFANPKIKTGPNSYAAFALKVASLSDPELPAAAYTMKENFNKLFQYVYDLQVRHDTAFLSCGYDGMWIYNFANHKNPKLISEIKNYPDQGYNHSCSVSKDSKTLVFTDENPGLRIKRFNISNLHDSIGRSPVYDTLFGMPTYVDGSIPHIPFIKEDYVFISYYEDGVAVFDLKDSNKLTGSYDTYPENVSGTYHGFQGCWGVYPYLPSGTIIASDMTNGLFCLGFDTITGIDREIFPQEKISIFPNPVKGRFSIQLYSSKNERLKLALYELDGKEFWSINMPLSVGKNIMNFDLPQPNIPGLYILRISSGDEINYYKLLLQ